MRPAYFYSEVYMARCIDEIESVAAPVKRRRGYETDTVVNTQLIWQFKLRCSAPDVIVIPRSRSCTM